MARTTSMRHTAIFLALAAFTSAQAPAPVSQGCYTSITPLHDKGTATYQSSSACGLTCTGYAVFAMTQGNDCWCGNTLPAASAKTSDSSCDTPCNAYPDESCGGDNTWTVWLSGTNPDPPVYGGGSSDGGSSSTTAASSPRPTTSRHSVVTSVQQGTTVYITHSDTPSASSSPPPANSGSSTNVGAIAGGVVVGVLVLAAVIGGVFFFLRRRKRQAAEEEYKRTQVSDFMRGGHDKPPNTGYSQMSDSRLDPEAGARRNSEGSIADAGDYSRRILRVANPDRG